MINKYNFLLNKNIKFSLSLSLSLSLCLCSLVDDWSILSIVSLFICLSVIFDVQTYLLGINALHPICEKFEISGKRRSGRPKVE